MTTGAPLFWLRALPTPDVIWQCSARNRGSMDYSFYSLASLPRRGEIVFAKWPMEKSGDPRPVLVSHINHRTYTPTGLKYGSVWVYYGTGNFGSSKASNTEIHIHGFEIEACGLKKPTRFNCNSSKQLIWAADFFEAPKYYKKSDPFIGELSSEMMREADIIVHRLGRCL